MLELRKYVWKDWGILYFVKNSHIKFVQSLYKKIKPVSTNAFA